MALLHGTKPLAGLAGALLLLLIFTGTVRAAEPSSEPAGDPLAAARAAFVAGDYDGAAALAADIGERDGNAAAYAFAARAVLAKASFLPIGTDRLDATLRGKDYSRQAITLDPDNVEGHLQLAVALGYEGRAMGKAEAHGAGLADTAREHIDRAMSLNPRDPFAHGVLGAWHLEIVARAGGFFGGMMYGADEDDGIAAFETARRLAPDDPLFDYQYALCLLALDVADNADTARTVLQDQLRVEASSALEARMAQEAQGLLDLLAAGDEDAVEARVKALQGQAPD